MMISPALAPWPLRHGFVLFAMVVLLAACGGQATSLECEVDADCGEERFQCIAGFCVDIGAVEDTSPPLDIGGDTDDPGLDLREETDEPPDEVHDPIIPDEVCLEARPTNITLRAPAPGVGTLTSLQVRNCGDVAVEEVSWSISGSSLFSLAEPQAASALEPGESTLVRVRFASFEPVEVNAELSATVGLDEFSLARIRGILDPVEGPCVVATPAVVELGGIGLGSRTEGRTEVRNCGTVPLALSELVERSDELELEVDAFLGATLDPGAAWDLVFELTPDRVGSYAGAFALAFVEVTMDFVAATVSLRVLVTATVEGDADSCLAWEPSVLRLPSWASGEEASASAVVLRNCGSSDLDIVAVAAESGFEAGGDDLPLNLSAGASIDWTIRGADGLSPGTYVGRVRAEASDGTQASLAVEAVVSEALDLPCLQVLPSPTVAFGLVRPGANVERELEVVNCSALPTRVRLDALSGAFDSLRLEGSITTALEPGERRQVRAVAAPSEPGALRADWLVRDERGSSVPVVLTADVREPEAPCLLTTVEPEPPVSVAFGGETTVRIRVESCDARTLLLSDFSWVSPQPYVSRLERPRNVSGTTPASEVLELGDVMTLQGRLLGSEAGSFTLQLSMLVEGDGEALDAFEVGFPVEIDPPGEVCVGVEPPFVNFGILPEGGSASRNVEVFNCGEATVVLERVEPALLLGGIFQVTLGPGWGSEVPPGSRRAFTVQARDQADQERGRYEGEVQVLGTSVDGRAIELPVDVAVQLGAEPACLEVAPTRVVDGPVTVGEPRSWPVTVTNCGGMTTRVDRATFLQGGAGFSVSLPPLAQRTLVPGASLEATVTLTPTAAGLASDVLQVESAAASDGETAVVETEFEVAVQEPAPCVQLEPTSVAFGPVEIGQVATRTVTATNCGDRPLRLSAIRIVSGAPRFVVATVPTSERVLLAGERRTLQVRFEPANEGVRTGVLEVVADPLAAGPTTAVTATLRGEGVLIPPCFEWSQDLVDLGSLRPGERQERTVSVRNCGEGPIDALALALTPQNTGWTATLAPSSQPLMPGAVRSVTLTFESSQVGLAPASVTVFAPADPTGVSATLQLQARVSDLVCAQVLPENIAFGVVAPASTTERTFQVVNCGTMPASIAEVVLQPSVSGLRLEGDLAGRVLQPGQSAAGRVVLEAGTQGRILRSSLRAELRSVSDPSADAQVATAEVTATVQPQQLCLAWEPPSVDFGEVPASTLRTRSASLRNCGNVAVVLDRFTNALPAFTLRNRSSLEGATLSPGSSREVEIGFLASTANTYLDQLVAEASGPGGTSVSQALTLQAEIPPEPVCFELFPTALDFGEVAPGQARERTVTVTNCGAEPLSLEPGLFDPPTEVFTLRLEQLPVVVEVAPGESASFVFRMVSDTPGAYASTYRAVFRSDGDSAEAALPMSGVVLPTQTCVTLAPALLDFGQVAIGSSTSRTVTVANCGDAPLRVEELSVVIGGPAFSVQGLTDANRTIAAGANRNYVVTFAPGQTGVSEGRLDMRARAVGAESAVTRTTLLRGEVPVVPPCLSVSPTQLSWGTVSGQETVSRTVRVSNCGTANLTLTEVRLTSGSPPFSITPSITVPRTLQPGEDLAVTVALASGQAAGSYSGNLRVQARGTQPTPLETRNIPLSAQVEPANRCLEAVTAAVDFGSIEVGSNSTETITLRNCGDVSLTVNRFLLSEGSAFAVTNFSPSNAILAPGATRSWTVRFTPPSAGTFTEDLFAEAADVDDVRIALSGQGLTPLPDRCMDITPTALDFGTVAINSSQERSFVVTNCGRQSVSVAGMTFRGQSGFTLVSPGLANGFTVAPGASRLVAVRFSSIVPGTYTGALQLSTPDSGGPSDRSVSLTATAAVFPSCPTLNARASRESAGPFGDPIFVRRGQTVILNPGLGRDLAPSESFSWQFIELPQGVSAPSIVTTGNQGRATVTLPATGRYRVRARLTTVPGMGGCDVQETVTIRVTERTGTNDGLRFVMTWSTPGDPDESRPPGSDVDMHLVRVVNGRAVWNSGEDIYFGNRTSDWGVRGDPTDNPELLRDETQGRGPEIIVHPNPNRQEVYLLGAYYWSDRNFGPSTVTFRIFRDGVEILSFNRVLEATGRFWLAARLDLEGEIITLLPEPNRNGFPPDTVVPQVP